MSEENTSYRQIMKATSIFGGVQVINIIISIIRSKFVAVLLGPGGMGIYGLFTSTTGLIEKITNLGLSTSAVRNVAAANASGDQSRIGTVVSVLRRLVWITGIAGALFTFLAAPWLSDLTFGNRDYTIGFRWVAITLLLTQITAGQMVVLQGMRQINYLARANLAGSMAGLLISVPIYYVWGLDGIIPAIIVSSIVALLISWYFSSKVSIEKCRVDQKTVIAEGSDMVKLGFMLSLSSLIAMASSYLIRIYISHAGSVDEVGLYNAGFAIINTYVGMVFTAMSTDYFPRLSGVAHDIGKTRDVINQQAEVAILILAPILAVFLIFINWVVILLYSTRFLPVVNMIHWAALGIFFKAASWPIAYLIIAKGDSKTFFASELAVHIYMLGFNILGYLWGGLEGLGISYLAGYILYLVQVFTIVRKKYSFYFLWAFARISVIQFMLGISCFIVSRFLSAPYLYLAGTVLISVSVYLSYKELDRRVGLKMLIADKLLKKKQS